MAHPTQGLVMIIQVIRRLSLKMIILAILHQLVKVPRYRVGTVAREHTIAPPDLEDHRLITLRCCVNSSNAYCCFAMHPSVRSKNLIFALIHSTVSR